MYSDLTIQILLLSGTKENVQHEEPHELHTGQQPTSKTSTEQQWLSGENVRHGQFDDSSNGQRPTNDSSVKQQWLSGKLMHLKCPFHFHYNIADVIKCLVSVYTRSTVLHTDIHLCVNGGGIVCGQSDVAQTLVSCHYCNAYQIM